MPAVVQTQRTAAIATLINYATYSLWTLANKWQFSSEAQGGWGITTPVFITSMQMLIAGMVSYVLIFLFNVQRSATSAELFSVKVVKERILPLGIARGVDIGCGNFALVLVSVSLQQVVKSLLPVFVSILSVTLLNKSILRTVWMSLVPIIVGCALATMSKSPISMVGILLAVISCVARAFKAVLNAKLLHCEGDNLRPLEILLLEAPTTGLLLLGPAVALEGSKLWTAMSHPPLALIFYNLLCGVLMFFNQMSYITVIEQTSALTCQVIMKVKMLLLILVSVYIFHTNLSWLNYFGILIAAGGVFLYAEVSKLPAKAVSQKAQSDMV